jgi:hypothetical protein
MEEGEDMENTVAREAASSIDLTGQGGVALSP